MFLLFEIAWCSSFVEQNIIHIINYQQKIYLFNNNNRKFKIQIMPRIKTLARGKKLLLEAQFKKIQMQRKKKMNTILISNQVNKLKEIKIIEINPVQCHFFKLLLTQKTMYEKSSFLSTTLAGNILQDQLYQYSSNKFWRLSQKAIQKWGFIQFSKQVNYFEKYFEDICNKNQNFILKFTFINSYIFIYTHANKHLHIQLYFYMSKCINNQYLILNLY
ncbi:hypothetical protein TTHERM_000016199 (macronuclear) [Tetrahymena thermophila SB210]|uniref:Uncharacterized protein n=1 Tax=Tetrahymena thermophila (strain SB210) TaxID=312017 RepID=W7XLJ0_TETTS|nr:hypothetical protein TTHERM_000016199 [Tetrahymena thermophila SB210]EWS76374.1 hypothetical protein TTHERM_000016199 [Tetrahymena thermophila SB210]|eukprot:XP_012651158.1 hypothetical protein TTHERM_000016199 [Tetrahymena thermophila SB210]